MHLCATTFTSRILDNKSLYIFGNLTRVFIHVKDLAKANTLAEKEILPLADKSFNVTVLRQATVHGYSPRMRFDLAINGMVLDFYKNGKIPIMRDGKQWRPLRARIKKSTLLLFSQYES